MSGGAKPKFSAGDKVFAKVRGYPPWPARVEGSADETPNKMKYHVYFYGTGETAIVKSEDICDFVKNKVKLGKPKKHKGFTEALLQIEADLTPEQLEKLHEAETSAPDKSANISMNDSVVDDASRRSSVASKPKESTSPTPTPTPKVSKPKETKKRKNEDSGSEEVVEKKKSIPAAATSDSEGKSEVMSRSGRKIKPKRFADYENDSGDEQNAPATPKPAAKVAPRMNPDYESEKSATGDVIYTFINAYVDNEKIRIPLDVEKPVALEPEGEEAWNAKVRNYAMQLKKRLESGERIPTSVEDHMMQWGREQARKAMLMNATPPAVEDARQEHIMIEGMMLELDLGIRGALSIKNPNTAKCIDLLDQLIDLKLTPLMLKKHPDIVQTIKKVRRYIGHVPGSFTEEQEQQFLKDSETIRRKAETVYNKFQRLFHVPHNKTFWEHFEDEKDYFYRRTKHMTTREIIDLVDEVF